MVTSPAEESLTDLPNIGREVARLLIAAEIRTPQMLHRIGAASAAVRISHIRPNDPPCRSMVAGLEGAIRRMRWHDLPKSDRERVWMEYQALANRPGKAARRCR
jgi:DNA transformation protein and related proteins